MSEENIQLLLVDDEERFRTTLVKRFAEKGMRVSQAGSARDALQQIRDKSFDVVVLDIKMPEMDGIEALEEIKKIEMGVEVILLTGHGAIDSAIEGMRLGAYDYLLKPCDFEKLLEHVQGAFAVKKARDERLREAKLRREIDRAQKHWTRT